MTAMIYQLELRGGRGCSRVQCVKEQRVAREHHTPDECTARRTHWAEGGQLNASIDASSTSLTVTTGQRPRASARRAASWCLHCAWGVQGQVAQGGAPCRCSCAPAGPPAHTHAHGLALVHHFEEEGLARAVVAREHQVHVRGCLALHLCARVSVGTLMAATATQGVRLSLLWSSHHRP